MHPFLTRWLFIGYLFLHSIAFVRAQSVRVLTNQVGYEQDRPKRAVIVADKPQSIPAFQVVDTHTGAVVFSGKPTYSGPVDHWKKWVFWTMDFSSLATEGDYQVRVSGSAGPVLSHPFAVGRNVLEQHTLSDLLYYFKGQRSSGLLDKADHHLPLNAGPTSATVDAHGGWYDASGDYGKHLSHLSFSSYFNPQQISLTVWSLFKTHGQLLKRPGTDFRQYLRRLLDEAMYGADYLVRVQAPGGSFYRSVGAPGPGKRADDRLIQPEQPSYRIKQSKEQSFHDRTSSDNWRSYQVSYRSGGGLAIAGLAMAAAYPDSVAGDYDRKKYLAAAERAFDFLEANNAGMTNDGRENMLDDYCALSAATELYRTTNNRRHQQIADKRARQLLGRLTNWKQYRDYWRVDAQDRPFFHPSDAGLPLVCLLDYYPLAPTETQPLIKAVVRRSLRHELRITGEVTNPFGYSRQLLQDTLGAGTRRSTFFFPHGSEASPWWQGENARLGSMATAARLAIPIFGGEKPIQDSLQRFSLDQLNWILGLNPFDASMVQGVGYNNPAYGFFGTFEYTNAPGGIVNGITSGLTDEHSIDFNLSYKQTGKDYDWRWAEQWLPHAAWYLLAISVNTP